MTATGSTRYAPSYLARAAGARDWVATVGCLLALVLWDFSGADAVVTGWFGNVRGFAWRNHFLTATVMHDGGRLLAWATLLGLLVCAVRQPVGVPVGVGVGSTPQRAERLYWFAVTLGCLMLIPTIKHFSATSCPWDLAEFGGTAHAVSHWLWGVPDGGSGHCFPSGHAVGAFAFLSQYFLWRPHRAGRARAWLMGVLAAGSIFGLGQLVRGAHPVSHSAWSAWLCWTACVLASAWYGRRSRSGA